MKYISGNKGSIILFSILFLIAIIPKFLWLSRFPVGMAHDEVIYLINGVSYALHGKDLSGFGLPLSLFRTETEGVISVLPTMVYAVFYKLIPLTQYTTRFFLTSINLITGFVLYLYVKELIKNKYVALLSAIIFLISPWSYFLARWVVDSPWALFFSLTTLWLLLKAQNKRTIALTIIFFIATFFSYQGAKIVILPLVLVTSMYKIVRKDNVKISKIFIAAVSILFISYLLIDAFLPGAKLAGRKDDIILFKSADYSNQVDAARKNSIENSYTSFFNNKVLSLTDDMMSKYSSSFSPSVLFFSGDLRATYRYEYHGLLYIVDAIFIFIGLLYLFSKKRTEFYYIAVLIIFAPIVTAISVVDTSQANRSYMLLPIFSLLIALGIFSIFESFKNNTIRVVFLSLVFLVYLVSYSLFLHFYFYRFPIESQENYFLSDRVIAEYLSNSQDREIVVVTSSPRSSFYEYLFYSGEDYLDTVSLEDNPDLFNFGNISFTAKCVPIGDERTIILSRTVECEEYGDHNAEIIDQKDAGMLYQIFNDETCKGAKGDIYRRFHYFSDYDIEDMNPQEFCNRWINSQKI